MDDTQRFEAFMCDHQNMVYGAALRLLGSPAEAEDVAQDVFLRAYQHFATLRDNPAAGAWLRKVATNLSLNHLSRYRSRWSFFSEWFREGDDEGASSAPEPACDTDPAAEVAALENSELLEQALQTLAASQRVPLVLYHLEDFSYEEIAERLGVSLGKVKTDIFRARQALRKKLQSQAALRLHFTES